MRKGVRLLVRHVDMLAAPDGRDGLVMKLVDESNILADVFIDQLEIMNASKPTDPIRQALRRLSAQSGYPIQDIVQLSLEARAHEYIGLFVHQDPTKPSEASPAKEPKAVELKTGWERSLQSIADALLGAHRHLPRAHIVKDRKEVHIDS